MPSMFRVGMTFAKQTMFPPRTRVRQHHVFYFVKSHTNCMSHCDCVTHLSDGLLVFHVTRASISLSYITLPSNVGRPFCLMDVAEFATKESQTFKMLHACICRNNSYSIYIALLLCPDMIDCEITSNRCNYILIRNH